MVHTVYENYRFGKLTDDIPYDQIRKKTVVILRKRYREELDVFLQELIAEFGKRYSIKSGKLDSNKFEEIIALLGKDSMFLLDVYTFVYVNPMLAKAGKGYRVQVCLDKSVLNDRLNGRHDLLFLKPSSLIGRIKDLFTTSDERDVVLDVLEEYYLS